MNAEAQTIICLHCDETFKVESVVNFKFSNVCDSCVASIEQVPFDTDTQEDGEDDWFDHNAVGDFI